LKQSKAICKSQNIINTRFFLVTLATLRWNETIPFSFSKKRKKEKRRNYALFWGGGNWV